MIMGQQRNKHMNGTTRPAREKAKDQSFTIEIDREDDGRWIAEIPELPGVMVYGDTKLEAISAVQALALRVLADRTEQQKETMHSVVFACP
jgi:predicted RNase H-like HicB family nuclease